MPDSLKKPIVLAAAAHPDDIEFMMSGTLLRLKDAGADIHMWNLANGSCGTAVHSKERIILLRWSESLASSEIAGAQMHPPLCDDFQIFYAPYLLARVAAVLRNIRPDILLTPSPRDYLEDHQNACRLLVTAAFVRGMNNFRADPPVPKIEGDIVLYHALPHGLRDGLRQIVRPEHYVDITDCLSNKRKMLEAHHTQKEWLDSSQGMDAYVNEMERMSRQVGEWSGRFQYAEGWRRHNPLGFGPKDYDPLSELLGDACWIDPEYEEFVD